MKKKVNIFGKSVPVFVLVLLGIGLVSAALIPYFAQITGLVTVTQGLKVDNHAYNVAITETPVTMTSLESKNLVQGHVINNGANVPADVTFTQNCQTANTSGPNDCSDVLIGYSIDDGANFSGYINSLSCDSTVTSGNSIQTAIGFASAGNVVCVESGTYVEDVNVNKDITLVAINSPTSPTPAIVDGLIRVVVNGATVKGLRIDGLSVSGARAAIQVSASDVTIDSNVVSGMTGDGTGTIKGIHIYSTSGISDIVLTNNLLENIFDTGMGSVGIMIQGNVNGVEVTYNTIKDISSNDDNYGWDYATGIEDTPTSNWVGSPKNLVINNNLIANIQSVIEPGRGFGVDLDTTSNYADASEVTLKHNSFFNIPNDITNKDQLSNVLDITDNYFDNLVVNANDGAKDEIGPVSDNWVAGTATFNIPAGTQYNFEVLSYFPKMLLPDTYTLDTTVTA